jgi:hypothetical protein
MYLYDNPLESQLTQVFDANKRLLHHPCPEMVLRFLSCHCLAGTCMTVRWKAS